MLPSWCNNIVFYAIGSFFLLISVSCLFADLKLLKSRILSFLGKESFSIIIVHMFVLFTINGFLFVYLDSLNINHVLNIAVNFLVFTVLSLVFSKLFSMVLTPLTNKLCNFVWSKIGKKD